MGPDTAKPKYSHIYVDLKTNTYLVTHYCEPKHAEYHA